MKSNLNRNVRPIIALKTRNLLGLLASGLIILTLLFKIIVQSDSSVDQSIGSSEETKYPHPNSLAKTPTELLALTAQWQGQIASISWVTKPGGSSIAFEIQRSTNGDFFQKIDLIEIAGNKSGEELYKYDDFDARSLNTEQVFYRLKHINEDDLFSYSKVVSLNYETFNNKNLLKLIPNPATDFTMVEIGDILNSSAKLTVMDQSGKTIYQEGLNAENSTRIRLNVASWAKGVYIVRLAAGKKTSTQKLVVR